MENRDNENSLLMLLSEASSSYTNNALGRIIKSCDGMLEDELPAYVKENLADIDAECCKLMRNRLLLTRLISYCLDKKTEKCCSFTDVYAYTVETVRAIAKQEKADFDCNDYQPECKVYASAESCCLLLLLPLALTLEREKSVRTRLIASSKPGRVELEFAVFGELPDIDLLAEECMKTDRSSGLFFIEPLIAYNLKKTVNECGAEMTVKKNKLIISLPKAPKNAKINSYATPYIDNRFSLPYLLLAGIIRREI